MWCLELSLTGPSELVLPWCEQKAAAFAALPGVARADLYAPFDDPGSAAPFHDADAPPAMILLTFGSEADLAPACEAAGPLLADLPAGVVAEAGCFQRHSEPLEGDDLKTGGGASYVVRYRLPCSDVPAFVTEYLSGHLPIQADFPGIRRILGFEPVDGCPAGATPANYLVGNEVTFDDAEAFADAMGGPVLARLKAHSTVLPPREGLCTHHLMQRRPLR